MVYPIMKAKPMDTEFEAKFPDIKKQEIRQRLERAGAKLVRHEFLQKRVAFFPPVGEVDGRWLRVRDEGDKITMSFKIVSGANIEDQKEVCLTVNDFETTRNFLINIGCKEKAYQETKRELWNLDGLDITIDEWPFIHPFIEIEGKSEEEVKKASEELGFKWQDAIFGGAALMVQREYDIPRQVINDETPRIVFGEENPWESWLRKNTV